MLNIDKIPMEKIDGELRGLMVGVEVIPRPRWTNQSEAGK